MLFDIPNDEKICIGNVIDLKRKQLGLSIDYLIRGICSKNTYYKLQKDIVTESEIYDKLLMKVGLYYNYDKRENISYKNLWKFFQSKKWDLFDLEKEELLKQMDKKEARQYPIFISLSKLNNDDEEFDLSNVIEIQRLLDYELREMLSFFLLSSFTEKKMHLRMYP